MKQLFDIFNNAGHDLYYVGGYVRDKLLGLENTDVDFATSARPEDTIKLLEAAGFKAIPIGIEFGTIQTIVDEHLKVEITTYRCEESYTKGSRKPGVTFGDSIEGDLARRDFTFNALAMTQDGTVIDPFGGEDDLMKGLVRTPIDPKISFSDDPLRMLRACRFVARGIGRGIDDDTFSAMKQLSHLAEELSAERVFEEMTKLLVSHQPSLGLEEMSDSGLLRVLFPELQVVREFRKDQGKYHHLPVWEHTLLVVDSAVPEPKVRWAALFHDVSKPACWSVNKTGTHFYKHDRDGADVWVHIADRLRTSNDFKESIRQAIFEHQNLRGNLSDKALRRLVHRLGDNLDLLVKLREADIIGHKPSLRESSLGDLNQLVRRINRILDEGTVRAKLPAGTGTLIADALGLKPGPELGAIMKRMQQKIVDGDLKPDDDLVAVAKRLTKESVK